MRRKKSVERVSDQQRQGNHNILIFATIVNIMQELEGWNKVIQT